MRISNTQQVARPQYYDRNPSNKTKYNNSGAVAPHGSAGRWSYTVAVGKKAFIETLMFSILRNTAAAPAGQALCEVDYTPNGGSLTILGLKQLNTNGALDNTDVHLAVLGMMGAGDILAASDADASTGGTMTFIQTAKIQEFDA